METLNILGKDLLNIFLKSGVIYKLICKKCKVTYVGKTGRFLNTRVEEHKKNLGRKCDYHNVLSDHRKEYYINITYSINLKTDLVKYNG